MSKLEEAKDILNQLKVPQKQQSLECIEDMGRELIKLKNMSEEACNEILGRFMYV